MKMATWVKKKKKGSKLSASSKKAFQLISLKYIVYFQFFPPYISMRRIITFNLNLEKLLNTLWKVFN